MKNILVLAGFVFLLISWLSLPVSIIYYIYLWGAESWALGAAAWEACKVWFLCVLCIIPGFLCISVAES